MSTTELPRYLTSSEVADYLRVTRLVVERAARAGELTSIKIGRQRVYELTDVDAFVESRRQAVSK